MKKILLLLVLLSAQRMIAQTDYDKVPLSTKDECKNAEPTVQKAAAIVLDKSMNDISSQNAVKFIIMWMVNTEYSFQIDSKITDLAKKKNEGLLGVYMACMAKVVLDDPSIAKETDKVKEKAYDLLADFCSDASHDVTITKEVQKLIDAKRTARWRIISSPEGSVHQFPQLILELLDIFS